MFTYSNQDFLGQINFQLGSLGSILSFATSVSFNQSSNPNLGMTIGAALTPLMEFEVAIL